MLGQVPTSWAVWEHLAAPYRAWAFRKDGAIQCEEALKSDGFLIVTHGPADEMVRAKSILETMTPSHLDMHENTSEVTMPAPHSGEHEHAA